MILLMSGYTWLLRLAFTDFCRKKESNSMRDFNSKDALTACRLSSEVYNFFDEEKSNQISMREMLGCWALNLQFLKTVRHLEKDLKMMICKKVAVARDSSPSEVDWHAHDRFFIVFRGTVSWENFSRVNLLFQRRKVRAYEWCDRKCIPNEDYMEIGKTEEEIKRSSENWPNIRIHSGFYNAWEDMREEAMKFILQKIFQQHELAAKFTQIIVCGHSLGGALAQLCALQLKLLTGLNIQVYTFGSPRVGDKSFCRWMNEHVPNNYRLTMLHDPVTTIPKGIPAFKHSGVPCWLDKEGHMMMAPSWTERRMLTKLNLTNITHHQIQTYEDALIALNKGLEDSIYLGSCEDI